MTDSPAHPFGVSKAINLLDFRELRKYNSQTYNGGKILQGSGWINLNPSSPLYGQIFTCHWKEVLKNDTKVLSRVLEKNETGTMIL